METKTTSIELQSLVDTHEQPFVIIDRDFKIVAVNSAYEHAYSATRAQMVGQPCYRVSHQNDRPCFELGEECPHHDLYQNATRCSCLHIHYDTQGRAHRVKINAFPLMDVNGEMYLGEAIEDISIPDERYSDQVRMVGQSAAFLRSLEQLKIAGSADAPVLLQGWLHGDTAARLLAEMPTGGRTPLNAALVRTDEVLRSQLTRDPTSRPIAVLITDGRSNVALGSGRPVDECLELARRLGREERVRFILVDTEAQGLIRFGLAEKIAQALQGSDRRHR